MPGGNTHNRCTFPLRIFKRAIDDIRLSLVQDAQCDGQSRRRVPGHFRAARVGDRIDGLLCLRRPIDLKGPEDTHHGDSERALGNVVAGT